MVKMSLNHKTLFIVASPFQCLCMIEAIHQFKISNFDILVVYSNMMSLDKIDALMNKYQYTYKKLKMVHLFYDVVPILFKVHKHYQNVFMGDYCSPHCYSIAVLYASLFSRLFYMDDGTQALLIFSEKPPVRYANYSVKMFMLLINIIRYVKMIGKIGYFTIYDVTSKKYNVIRNQLVSLRSKDKGTPKGVYIIGTNSSMLDFKDTTYFDYIKAIRYKYKEKELFYCPHRQDKNNEKIFDLCRTLEISCFNTEVSVEFDFVTKNIIPEEVIGFNSNALIVLKKIFPNLDCSNIMYHVNNDIEDAEYELIRKEMQNYGVTIISVI